MSLKPRPDLVPADALVSVAAVLAHGAAKHGERGWEAGRSRAADYGAACRHLWAWWCGEDRDPESGLPHLAHAAARLLLLLGAHLRDLPGDDRTLFPPGSRPAPDPEIPATRFEGWP